MLKKNAPIYLFAILLAAVFLSRALLSLTLLAWTGFAIWQFVKTKNPFYKTPIFIWSCMPLCFWLLGAWQNSLTGDSINYLLTLAAYPATLCIVESVPVETIEKKWIPIWLLATGIGLTYPIGWYLLHFTSSNEAYGSGKSLPTFMDSDHVRFSIFLCSSFLLLLLYPTFKKLTSQILASILFVLILFLSVRTGWIIVISILLIYAILAIRKNKKIAGKKMAWALVLLLGMITLSYFVFPTVHQKIAYSIWDWNQFQPGKYDSNYSDATRRAVNYSAWNSIKNNFASNAGWVSVPAALQKSFSSDFANQKTEYGWPFNQWLYWWMGSGWWGMLLFTGWLFYPLLLGMRKENTGLVCWTIAIALSCIVESTLNFQFGVFLHVWPIAILWKIGYFKIR